MKHKPLISEECGVDVIVLCVMLRSIQVMDQIPAFCKFFFKFFVEISHLRRMYTMMSNLFSQKREKQDKSIYDKAAFSRMMRKKIDP